MIEQNFQQQMPPVQEPSKMKTFLWRAVSAITTALFILSFCLAALFVFLFTPLGDTIRELDIFCNDSEEYTYTDTFDPSGTTESFFE